MGNGAEIVDHKRIIKAANDSIGHFLGDVCVLCIRYDYGKLVSA